ncbi:hypothetical protein EMPS_07251 [Entomortierella parvispora]|uniref:Uncharacterized protein n=1 Tax=Entomortierella parvispora TaxID=205924 RepID=A0A9P3HE80_9FUNG|nr:hypothetical protein EMPS_07251 [Entomortierella parvispora]
MSKLRILVELAVTRTEIGSFRQVKTNTRSKDYCRCIFEQELETLECIAAWICLGKGPALRLPSGTATTMVYNPANRHLRIIIDTSLAEGLCWQLTPADRTPCDDPTAGELARSHAIDLYLSRLVEESDVQHTIGMMSAATIRSRLPSSQSTECSPFMSPSGLLSPSFSEDTLWMPSGESTPHRLHSSFQSYLDTPDKYSSDVNGSLESSEDPEASKGLGIVHSPKQGPLICGVSEPPYFGTGDPYSPTTAPPSSPLSTSSQSSTGHCGQNLDESVQAARGRSLRSSRHEFQPYSPAQGHLLAKNDEHSHRHRLLLALLQAKTNAPLSSTSVDLPRASPQDRQIALAASSCPSSPSRRQRCSSHTGLSWLQLPHMSEIAMPLSNNRVRRHSCDGRVELRPFLSKTKTTAPLDHPTSSKSGMAQHSKRTNLTISTDVARRGSLWDTSMSSISAGSIDRRHSISSTMSDVSDSSFCLRDTSSTSPGNSALSARSSNKVAPRKGGPPVHYTLMCWIGGRWPCKLRPLIKRSKFQDIHAMLRRNLRLPASFFIDIEFDWEGDTYVILDASHWQWAREQVHFGDMTVRCHIWQKKYSP